MNNFILSIIGVLLVIFALLFSFYYRDIIISSLSHAGGYVCEPLDLTISDLGTTSFTVSWKTAKNCLGSVKYGASIDDLNMIEVGERRHISRMEHVVTIEDLRPGSVYYFVIYSDGTNYGIEGSPIILSTSAF